MLNKFAPLRKVFGKKSSVFPCIKAKEFIAEYLACIMFPVSVWELAKCRRSDEISSVGGAVVAPCCSYMTFRESLYKPAGENCLNLSAPASTDTQTYLRALAQPPAGETQSQPVVRSLRIVGVFHGAVLFSQDLAWNFKIPPKEKWAQAKYLAATAATKGNCRKQD